jgi:hypothetical protein
MEEIRMIILTPNQHLDEIMSRPMSQRERLRQIDEQSLDVLYDDVLRQVAYAVAEPEPSHKRPSHMIAAFALNCMFWVPVIVVAIEILRP